VQNESGGGVEWAARLEAQLSEMIAELDQQKLHKAASPQVGACTRRLPTHFSSAYFAFQAAVEEGDGGQGHDDAELVRLRTQLRMAEHKCQVS